MVLDTNKQQVNGDIETLIFKMKDVINQILSHKTQPRIEPFEIFEIIGTSFFPANDWIIERYQPTFYVSSKKYYKPDLLARKLSVGLIVDFKRRTIDLEKDKEKIRRFEHYFRHVRKDIDNIFPFRCPNCGVPFDDEQIEEWGIDDCDGCYLYHGPERGEICHGPWDILGSSIEGDAPDWNCKKCGACFLEELATVQNLYGLIITFGKVTPSEYDKHTLMSGAVIHTDTGWRCIDLTVGRKKEMIVIVELSELNRILSKFEETIATKDHHWYYDKKNHLRTHGNLPGTPGATLEIFDKEEAPAWVRKQKELLNSKR